MYFCSMLADTTYIFSQLVGSLPELILVSGFVSLLVLYLLVPAQWVYIVYFLVFFVTVLSDLLAVIYMPSAGYYWGMIELSPESKPLKMLIALSGLLFGWLYLRSKSHTSALETLTVALLLLLGAQLLVVSVHWLLMFISFELISLAGYVLVIVTQGKSQTEAGIKYVLYGMVVAALLTYGISVWMGAYGTLTIRMPYVHMFTIPALLLIWLALLFKISSFPWHMWVADVYEATPPHILALLGSVGTLGGFGFMYHFSKMVTWDSHPSYSDPYLLIIALVGLAGTTLGNVAALFQTDVKRMFGYSAIAQNGFLLVLFSTSWVPDFQHLFYFLVVYMLSVYLFFYIIQCIGTQIQSFVLSSLKGIGRSSSLLGVGLVMVLMSLTGIPPFPGFLAKLYVFGDLWAAFSQQTIWSGWVLLFLVLNTVIALFYYLRPLHAMYIQSSTTAALTFSVLDKIAILLLSLLLLSLFIAPTIGI